MGQLEQPEQEERELEEEDVDAEVLLEHRQGRRGTHPVVLHPSGSLVQQLESGEAKEGPAKKKKCTD